MEFNARLDGSHAFLHHAPMQDKSRPVLGIPEMDAQHDYLYRLFDELAASDPFPEGALESLLDEIAGYLDFHITSEEHLIRFYKVPGFALHQSDHEQAARMFLRYMDEFEGGELNPRMLHTALAGWLSGHAATLDMQYAEHIKTARRARRVGR
jgi:hemerythrin-like metal-binding protein